MTFEVRRVVTGYGEDGQLTVTSDSVLSGARKGPVGVSLPLWSAKSLPVALDDEGQHPRPSHLQWYLVQVPPDDARGPAADDFEAGILHEGNSIDLGIVVSGEVWLELDGQAERVHLKPGDTFVQRGTKHAWHNPGKIPAVLSCLILAGARSDATPSHMVEGDRDFRQDVKPG